jgi:hypothetical protein
MTVIESRKIISHETIIIYFKKERYFTMSTTKKNVTANKFYSNDVAINEIFELAKKLDSNATLLVKQSTDEKYITLFGENGVKSRSQVWFCSKKIDVYVGNNVVNQSLNNVCELAMIDNAGKAKHSKNERVLSYASFESVKSFFESVLSDIQKQSDKKETTKKESANKKAQSKKRTTTKKESKAS